MKKLNNDKKVKLILPYRGNEDIHLLKVFALLSSYGVIKEIKEAIKIRTMFNNEQDLSYDIKPEHLQSIVDELDRQKVIYILQSDISG